MSPSLIVRVFLCNLFRYNGEEIEGAKTDQEAVILARLQKKINKRKRARLAKKAVQPPVQNSPLTGINRNEDEKNICVEEKQQERKESADNKDETENSEAHKKIKKQRKSLKTRNDINEQEVITELSLGDNVGVEKIEKLIGEGFTVLGSDNFKKKQKVKRVLPYWLSHPTVVSVNLQDLNCKVENIAKLSQVLKDNLKNNSISDLFPVQAQLVPYLLTAHCQPEPFWPCDVCVSAPTGSGKTLAFVLPIVQALSARVVCHIRALVVLPVQELAAQVAAVFRKMCAGSDLKVALLSASTSISTEQSMLVWKSHSGMYMSNVDIVVSTAGRLVEHLHSTEGFSLAHLRFLVLDEADRVMEQAQNDWLYHLDKHVKAETFLEGRAPLLTVDSLTNTPRPPQKLLFSATLSQDPEKLQRLGLFQPKLFTSIVEGSENKDGDTPNSSDLRGDFIGKYTTPAELKEQYCICDAQTKPLTVYQLIQREKWRNILCFTNTTQTAHRLALLLQLMCKDLKIAEISAVLSHKARDDVLRNFTEGNVNILISSDALARGIDVPNVQVVVSYDPPKYVKSYIHRVGRTGRAGKLGTAVTLVQNIQLNAFQSMLKSGGKDSVDEITVSEQEIEKDMEKYTEALESLKLTLNEEEVESLAKTKSLKRGRDLKRKTGDANNRKFKKKKKNPTETN